MTLDKASHKRGWLYSTHDADGTVQHTFYDYLGRVTQQWVGTNDVPTSTEFDYYDDEQLDPRDFHYWNLVLNVDPTATVSAGVANAGQSGDDGTRMYLVSANSYDADSNLTQTTQYVDDNPADNRVTTYGYDWRDRQVFSVNPADAQGDVTYTYTQYDNLDEATGTQEYLYEGTKRRRTSRQPLRRAVTC